MAKTNRLEVNSGKFGTFPQEFRVLPDADASLSKADSGKLMIIEDVSADRVYSLPTSALERGLNYKFWYVGDDADGHDFSVDTGSTSNFIKGGVVFLDSDASGDNVELVESDGDSNRILKVDTPGAGTEFTMVCDGTKWYLNGQVVSVTTPAFSDS
jgi:hypothetical protein|tara:strand:- start:4625 stop:5092 length:468 start_codon:yes stop_codon:yes gene_type:complete